MDDLGGPSQNLVELCAKSVYGSDIIYIGLIGVYARIQSRRGMRKEKYWAGFISLLLATGQPFSCYAAGTSATVHLGESYRVDFSSDRIDSGKDTYSEIDKSYQEFHDKMSSNITKLAPDDIKKLKDFLGSTDDGQNVKKTLNDIVDALSGGKKSQVMTAAEIKEKFGKDVDWMIDKNRKNQEEQKAKRDAQYKKLKEILKDMLEESIEFNKVTGNETEDLEGPGEDEAKSKNEDMAKAGSDVKESELESEALKEFMLAYKRNGYDASLLPEGRALTQEETSEVLSKSCFGVVGKDGKIRKWEESDGIDKIATDTNGMPFLYCPDCHSWYSSDTACNCKERKIIYLTPFQTAQRDKIPSRSVDQNALTLSHSTGALGGWDMLTSRETLEQSKKDLITVEGILNDPTIFNSESGKVDAENLDALIDSLGDDGLSENTRLTLKLAAMAEQCDSPSDFIDCASATLGNKALSILSEAYGGNDQEASDDTGSQNEGAPKNVYSLKKLKELAQSQKGKTAENILIQAKKDLQTDVKNSKKINETGNFKTLLTQTNYCTVCGKAVTLDLTNLASMNGATWDNHGAFRCAECSQKERPHAYKNPDSGTASVSSLTDVQAELGTIQAKQVLASAITSMAKMMEKGDHSASSKTALLELIERYKDAGLCTEKQVKRAKKSIESGNYASVSLDTGASEYSSANKWIQDASGTKKSEIMKSFSDAASRTAQELASLDKSSSTFKEDKERLEKEQKSQWEEAYKSGIVSKDAYEQVKDTFGYKKTREQVSKAIGADPGSYLWEGRIGNYDYMDFSTDSDGKEWKAEEEYDKQVALDKKPEYLPANGAEKKGLPDDEQKEILKKYREDYENYQESNFDGQAYEPYLYNLDTVNPLDKSQIQDVTVDNYLKGDSPDGLPIIRNIFGSRKGVSASGIQVPFITIAKFKNNFSGTDSGSGKGGQGSDAKAESEYEKWVDKYNKEFPYSPDSDVEVPDKFQGDNWKETDRTQKGTDTDPEKELRGRSNALKDRIVAADGDAVKLAMTGWPKDESSESDQMKKTRAEFEKLISDANGKKIIDEIEKAGVYDAVKNIFGEDGKISDTISQKDLEELLKKTVSALDDYSPNDPDSGKESRLVVTAGLNLGNETTEKDGEKFQILNCYVADVSNNEGKEESYTLTCGPDGGGSIYVVPNYTGKNEYQIRKKAEVLTMVNEIVLQNAQIEVTAESDNGDKILLYSKDVSYIRNDLSGTKEAPSKTYDLGSVSLTVLPPVISGDASKMFEINRLPDNYGK